MVALITVKRIAALDAFIRQGVVILLTVAATASGTLYLLK